MRRRARRGALWSAAPLLAALLLFAVGVLPPSTRDGGRPDAPPAGRLTTAAGGRPPAAIPSPHQLGADSPDVMDELFRDGESAGAQRATEAMPRMKKLDVAALRRAYEGAA